jgi:hypothetical protein
MLRDEGKDSVLVICEGPLLANGGPEQYA